MFVMSFHFHNINHFGISLAHYTFYKTVKREKFSKRLSQDINLQQKCEHHFVIGARIDFFLVFFEGGRFVEANLSYFYFALEPFLCFKNVKHSHILFRHQCFHRLRPILSISEKITDPALRRSSFWKSKENTVVKGTVLQVM